jgi:hypothetical protein
MILDFIDKHPDVAGFLMILVMIVACMNAARKGAK